MHDASALHRVPFVIWCAGTFAVVVACNTSHDLPSGDPGVGHGLSSESTVKSCAGSKVAARRLSDQLAYVVWDACEGTGLNYEVTSAGLLLTRTVGTSVVVELQSGPTQYVVVNATTADGDHVDLGEVVVPSSMSTIATSAMLLQPP